MIFQYEKTGHPRWKYRVLNFYVYETSFYVCCPISNTWVYLIPRRFLKLIENYHWNGLDFFPDIAWMMRAGAIHDALCQLANEGLLSRKIADKEFRRVLIEDCPEKHKDFWLTVVEAMYLAVRAYAILNRKH
jgi:hypothetical protein